jgi:hypothetical protein
MKFEIIMLLLFLGCGLVSFLPRRKDKNEVITIKTSDIIQMLVRKERS